VWQPSPGAGEIEAWFIVQGAFTEEILLETSAAALVVPFVRSVWIDWDGVKIVAKIKRKDVLTKSALNWAAQVLRDLDSEVELCD
jgi:hypothetical protein